MNANSVQLCLFLNLFHFPFANSRCSLTLREKIHINTSRFTSNPTFKRKHVCIWKPLIKSRAQNPFDGWKQPCFNVRCGLFCLGKQQNGVEAQPWNVRFRSQWGDNTLCKGNEEAPPIVIQPSPIRFRLGRVTSKTWPHRIKPVCRKTTKQDNIYKHPTEVQQSRRCFNLRAGLFILTAKIHLLLTLNAKKQELMRPDLWTTGSPHFQTSNFFKWQLTANIWTQALNICCFFLNPRL